MLEFLEGVSGKGAGIMVIVLLLIAFYMRLMGRSRSVKKIVKQERPHLKVEGRHEEVPVYEVKELTLEDWEHGRGLSQ